jgi:SecD/SecF fusion protein
VARSNAVRAVLAVGVLAVSGWLVASRPPNLGLDLRGGTQIVLQTEDGELAKANAGTTEEAVEILRRRIDQLGVSEPTLARSGDRRIIVELPGVTNPGDAIAVIGRTAQLTFHPVVGTGGDGRSLPDEHGQPITLGPAALDGRLISKAQASIGQFGEWGINVDFRGDGPKAWRDLTAKAACATPGDPARRVAIVLDDKVISSPQVVPEIGCGVGMPDGRTTISGNFSAAEAKDLALLIRAGGLPVPVTVIEQRTVGPSLGQAAIEASATAAVLGVLATIIFIIAVYRLVGGLAAVALIAYGLISYAALLALGATLTLPGLAGFVLAIGMAVDANVLVFERAREEYADGRRSLRQSIDVGFRQAWSAILDSNMTTLLAAALLFFLASGAVRGFGVTLSIGVIASMFTALVLTRLLAGWALRRRAVTARPRLSGLAGVGAIRTWLERHNPNLMKYRRRFLLISVMVVTLAIGGLVVRGVNWGVEFTGGRLVEYHSAGAPLRVDQARAAASAAGLDRATVTASGDGGISVRAGSFDDGTEGRLRAALHADRVRDERIGPSLGGELRRKAVIALGVALAAQLVYLGFRFRWPWAAAAVLAMLHDVAVLVGVFAWLGKPFDGVFLAAVLTVIGYSVNDSVVVFDRIRELVRGRRRAPFAELANLGCLQTVPRTVNTGLGAVFVLVALALLGRDSLVDFALALLIGIGVGTYSSVFLATPLAVAFESRRGPARRTVPSNRERRPVPSRS